MPTDPRQALKQSDVVLRGRVTEVQVMDRSAVEERPRIIVEFAVAEYWKGTVGNTFKLHTYKSDIPCLGYNFETGKDYIVYAHKERAEWWLGGPTENILLYVFRGERSRLNGNGLPKDADTVWGTSACNRTSEVSPPLQRSEARALGKSKVPK